jgi:CubicO group peptidase (beta-lactamase class C family)
MRSLVLGLVLAVAPAPANIDSYLAGALDSTGLPGVSVVVTHGDEIVHATGAGHDSQGNPVTADTPMRVASVSKSFTAAAVLTLVEDGRLDLDGQVADLMPFPRGVTVRQLLNQTSGIDDSSVGIGDLAATHTLAEYVSRLSPTLSARPGTRWAYSNVNYDVAARLVEVVTQEPFDRYMREAVFEPLGMRDSAVGGRAADGYNSLFGMWFSRPELADGPAVNGAGAVVTTANDMGRWLIAQNGHGPFPASMLRTMHEPSPVDDYGMGWAPDDNGLLVHSGNLWTYNAIEAIDPRTGYGYAVMTNGAGLTDDTGAILAGLVALTRGETPETPGGTRQLVEWVLAGLALLSVGLGVMGVVRARRWVRRATGGRRSVAGTGVGGVAAGRPRLVNRRWWAGMPTANTGMDGSAPDQPPLASRRRRAGMPTANTGADGVAARRPPLVNRRQRTGRPIAGTGADGVAADRPRLLNRPWRAGMRRASAGVDGLTARQPRLVSRRWRAGRPMAGTGVDGLTAGGPRSVGRRWWVGLRLVVPLVPLALFGFYPQLVSFISAGRTVLWAQLFYFALPLTVTLAVAAAAGLAVFVARVVRLRSAT